MKILTSLENGPHLASPVCKAGPAMSNIALAKIFRWNPEVPQPGAGRISVLLRAGRLPSWLPSPVSPASPSAPALTLATSLVPSNPLTPGWTSSTPRFAFRGVAMEGWFSDSPGTDKPLTPSMLHPNAVILRARSLLGKTVQKCSMRSLEDGLLEWPDH